jgi:hypothetical protein
MQFFDLNNFIENRANKPPTGWTSVCGAIAAPTLEAKWLEHYLNWLVIYHVYFNMIHHNYN